MLDAETDPLAFRPDVRLLHDRGERRRAAPGDQAVCMPMLDGLEVTRRLTGPATPDPPRVLVVTTFDHDDYVRTALRDGACGFLLKRSGPGLLIEGVRAAMASALLINPQLTVRPLKSLAASAPPPAREPTPLTSREAEIARLVAEGLTNAEIAARLFISAGTAKTHIANIQAKLKVRNRVGIAAWCWETRNAPYAGP
ncbi:LuxR C-terminal-related transcriptional regulator [Streptomyces sp. NRRL S-337]|uniref:LuxR C-terminal-related transcriptional regulator n=1 Tax=Streptomyces sp. NRRL S-337 TaxID=1463900 RepID=UPI001F174676|nr:response regulator transcription factor [Streptomyces sp. NRRL S-337]